MNALKKVKKLIAIGLLANTLYITPIWAQPANPQTTVAATQTDDGDIDEEKYLKALGEVGSLLFDTDKYGNIDVADDYKEFFYNRW